MQSTRGGGDDVDEQLQQQQLEAQEEEDESKDKYGVDVSFPTHSHIFMKTKNIYTWRHNNRAASLMPLKGQREEFYSNFLQGCIREYDSHECLTSEWDRVELSLSQPSSMKNYTKVGYKKVKVPQELFDLILKFWESNKDKQTKETWSSGNTATNHWDVPTYMVSVSDINLKHGEKGGFYLRQQIYSKVKQLLIEWIHTEHSNTGTDPTIDLQQKSLYGIRVYKQGAVLSPHVDRVPLVISATMNIAQDLDEPWPLEVINHDGEARNVTMYPGEMILYESHSIIHGRPFELKGRYMANLFIHFEPKKEPLLKNSQPLYQDHQHRDDESVPPYFIPGSQGAIRWQRKYQRNPRENTSETKRNTSAKAKKKSHQQKNHAKITKLHEAALSGNLQAVTNQILIMKNSLNVDPSFRNNAVDVLDENGFTPLLEAVRGGHLEIVKFLVDQGADVNHRSHKGKGVTPLWVAKDHDNSNNRKLIVDYLSLLGAIELGPEF